MTKILDLYEILESRREYYPLLSQKIIEGSKDLKRMQTHNWNVLIMSPNQRQTGTLEKSQNWIPRNPGDTNLGIALVFMRLPMR